MYRILETPPNGKRFISGDMRDCTLASAENFAVQQSLLFPKSVFEIVDPVQCSNVVLRTIKAGEVTRN